VAGFFLQPEREVTALNQGGLAFRMLEIDV
jgi:hypothetical protein